jgi:NTP pyrophosphatase (non-canonical NTP hydrolase)
MTLEDKALKTIQNYGVLAQLKYFQSEVFELSEAIIKFENGIGKIEDIIDETADVEFMLLQFREWYEISKEEVYDRQEFKADRQLKRIELEKKNAR